MEYKIKAYSIWEKGKRPNQEDSIYPSMGKVTDEDRLFILCDGMGGHEHGEVASATVCDVISKYIQEHYKYDKPFTKDDFNQALEVAYEELDKKDTDEVKKMGTTLTFLMLNPGGALVAHIGDSRVYHVRPSEQKILFQTRDHSLVNDLLEVGELTPETAKTYPRKNVITRAIQPHQEQHARADFKEITDIKAGDYFLLCSDGMLEQLENHNIINILSDSESSDKDKVTIMKDVSRDSKDNHSAQLIHIVEVAGATVSDTETDPLEVNRPVAIVLEHDEEHLTEGKEHNEKQIPNQQAQAEKDDEVTGQENSHKVVIAKPDLPKYLKKAFMGSRLIKYIVCILVLLLLSAICMKIGKSKWDSVFKHSEKIEQIEDHESGE